MDPYRSRALLLSITCAAGALLVAAGCSATTETVSSTGTTAAANAGATTRSVPGTVPGTTSPEVGSSAEQFVDTSTPTSSPDTPVQSPASAIPETTITIVDPNQPPPPVTEPPTIPPTGEDPVLIDCGILYRASGWPTTMAPSTEAIECLQTAFDAGAPARLVDRAQTDGEGGAILITTYDVLGPGRVRVTVDAREAADRPKGITVSECSGLATELVTITTWGCSVVSS